MPNSVTSDKVLGTPGSALLDSVNSADNLADLVSLCPGPYRPRMQELVNRVYRAALKSNHARSYLATLERHKADGTLPPEIGGRVNTPAIQISKEYSATAACRELQSHIDKQVRNFKESLLLDAIKLKQEEIAHLQSLFREDNYDEETRTIAKEVCGTLCMDAGIILGPDRSVSDNDMPSWIQGDFIAFKQLRKFVCPRAIALAFMIVQQENVKKFKSLSLKQKIDHDVEMQDAPNQTQTVDALLSRRLEQFAKDHKLSKRSKHDVPALSRPSCLTDCHSQRQRTQVQETPTPTKSTKAGFEGQEVQGRR